MDAITFFIQAMNGIQYGLLLFLVASGLTLIFGIMGVINIAHGSFYMVGAYLAWSLMGWFGNFWVGLFAGVLVALFLGLALEWLFIRFLYVPFLNLIDQWQMILIFLSIASMLFGAIAAIGQTNLKRLIAYSSIGHIGYALAGLATGSNDGIQSSIIYITIYILMNLGLFSCLLMMKRNNQYFEDIVDLSGLSKNHPLLSLSLLVILFSLMLRF